jgi:uncharacterized protein
MTDIRTIPPRSGVAFPLGKGQLLTVIDPLGMQVADLLAFCQADVKEVISNGRTFDYEETLRLTLGNRLWSNRSRVLLTIEADSVNCHDFLLTPCSLDTFRHFYPDAPEHCGCFGKLAAALSPYGVGADQIPVAFNCFMNVAVGPFGKIAVLPPRSQAGDHISFRAEQDVIIGLTACSAYASNGGSFKPIAYRIEGAP